MIKKYVSSLIKLKRSLTNIEKNTAYLNKESYLLNLALNSNESLITNDCLNNEQLIVSLTTYSKRIHDVHLVIESIGQQTLKANKIILWLDENEFTYDNIPLILKNQMLRGLDIRFCPNFKSYKKLIPTLKSNENSNIITIDDDILYPYDMIELLYREHKEYPKCVIGHRVHSMKFDSYGNILPYKQWDHDISGFNASIKHMAIGVGGIFYPKDILHSNCLDENVFMDIAPNADDVWFKAMSLLNNIPHKKVSDNRNFWSRFLIIEKNQDIALYNSNLTENGNDLQIKSIFIKYNLFNKFIN